MKLERLRALPMLPLLWVALVAASAASAAPATPPAEARANDAVAPAQAPSKGSAPPSTSEPGTEKAAAGKSRLRFRSAEGTCSCTCASGGISEDAIQQAQAARQRASP